MLAAVETDKSALWHLDKFAEFTLLKSKVGEPSPHMTVAGWMCRDVGKIETIWRAGVYAAPYSVLTSEAIWTEWPWTRARDDPDGLVAWINQHWEGFHIRTERRMVRTRATMAQCILSWRHWMLTELPDLLALSTDQQHIGGRTLYDKWWVSIMGDKTSNHPGVHNFGRYITIRVLEFLNRYARTGTELHDIRSVGGDSPVRCLALLFPSMAADLLSNTKGSAEAVSEILLAAVKQISPDANHYVLAAMLCEYREAYEDRHQYPARTLDQELDYQDKPAADYWRKQGHETQLWTARRELFPEQALGEVQGWTGIRHDLSRWLRDKGENWTDVRYDYTKGGVLRA